MIRFRPFLLCFLLLIGPTLAKAQAKFPSTGRLTVADFDVTLPTGEEEAEAVDILHKSSVWFDCNNTEGFTVKEKVLIRRKILKSEGAIKGTFTLKGRIASGDEDDFHTIKGYTYNLVNGKVVRTELGSNGTFVERSDDEITKRLVFPNVQEGSIVELYYELTSPYVYDHRPFVFRKRHPVIKTSLTIEVPNFISAFMHERAPCNWTTHTTEQGFLSFPGMIDPLTRNSYSGPSDIYQYDLVYQRGLKEFPYSTCPEDYANRVLLEVRGVNYGQIDGKKRHTWKDIAHEFLEWKYFKNALNANLPMPVELAGKVSTTPGDTLRRIRATFSYVQNRFVLGKGRDRSSKRSMHTVFGAGIGSDDDICLIFVNLLNQQGISAYPMLVSTRSHGLPPAFPTTRGYDRVIAAFYKKPIHEEGRVTDPDLLMDPSDKSCPFGLLPLEVQNHLGLLLHPEAGRLVSTEQANGRRSTLINARLKFDPKDNAYSGTWESSLAGYEYAELNSKYRNLGHEKLTSQLQSRYKLSEPPSLTFDSSKIISVIKAAYSYTPVDAEDELFLDPLAGTGLTTNPFLAETRDQNVDLGGNTDFTFITNLDIPPGYEVATLPTALNAAMPGGKAKAIYAVTQQGNVLNTQARLQFRSAIFTPEEYPALRSLCQMLMTKQSEQIVLKKIKK